MRISPFGANEYVPRNVYLDDGIYNFKIKDFKIRNSVTTNVPQIEFELGIFDQDRDTGAKVKTWCNMEKNPNYEKREDDFALHITAKFFKSLGQYHQLESGNIDLNELKRCTGRAEFKRLLSNKFVVYFIDTKIVDKYYSLLRDKKCFCICTDMSDFVLVGADRNEQVILHEVDDINLKNKIKEILDHLSDPQNPESSKKVKSSSDKDLIEGLSVMAKAYNLMPAPKYFTPVNFLYDDVQSDEQLNDKLPF